MHKVFFRFNHSPLVFIAHSVAHTHTYTRYTIFIIIKSGQRPINTHIQRNVYVYKKNICIFLDRAIRFVSSAKATHVLVCVCVTICHSDCARHQKSKMAAHFLQIQNAKNKKNKIFFFLKLFSTMGCCCCYYFRCVFSCCFRAIFSFIHIHMIYF